MSCGFLRVSPSRLHAWREGSRARVMVALSQCSAIVYRFSILGVKATLWPQINFWGAQASALDRRHHGCSKTGATTLLDNDAAWQAWVAVRSVTAPQEEHRAMFRSVRHRANETGCLCDMRQLHSHGSRKVQGLMNETTNRHANTCVGIGCMPSRIHQSASFVAVLTFVALFSGCEKHHRAVTTYHYDNFRTGWNHEEKELTYSKVQSAHFGLIQNVTLDDQVDTQPLIVPRVDIPTGPSPGAHDVVYVATESNTIYAIDASSGEILLHPKFGNPVPLPLQDAVTMGHTWALMARLSSIVKRTPCM